MCTYFFCDDLQQCATIRTSDLPAALEDLSKVQKLETDIKNRLSIPTLLERLQGIYVNTEAELRI
jgi:hypothetical protein